MKYETLSWDAALKDFATQAAIHGPLPMAASRLLEIELILTMLADHFPDQPPHLGWTVLNGLPFPGLQRQSEVTRRAVEVARLRLTEMPSRSAWQRSLRLYRSLSAPYPLYSVTETSVELRSTSLMPERLEILREALRTPPVNPGRDPNYVRTPGVYRFNIQGDPHEVEIPRRSIDIPLHTKIPSLRTSGGAVREPILISLEDLQAEAEWMDRNAPPGSVAAQHWSDRMRVVHLRLVSSQGLEATRCLTLDGLKHLLGIVGSGKSTLFTVLAVYLARRGKQVTIIQNDVASLLREFAVFEALREADPQITSVPLVGRSTRLTHLNRLHHVEAQEQGPCLGGTHPAHNMFSTVCPLDGLRRDVDPVPSTQEPCTRLYLPHEGNGSREQRPLYFDCPFMPRCPVHLPSRTMPSARIWLATPASLLSSSPQAPLIPSEMRNVELVMRYADVVLVDEADAVQVRFDDHFAPFETLVGHKDAWLDRLATQVPRQVYKPSRPRVGRNREFDRWRIAHGYTQLAADRLFFWLRESADTRNWLGETYFSRTRLLQKVGDEIRRLGGDVEAFDRACDAFGNNPLALAQGGQNEELPPAWHAAMHLEFTGADEADSLGALEAWLREHNILPHDRDERLFELIAHRLLIALLVGVLDHSLERIISSWGAAEAEIELDRGSGGMFYRPSDTLIRTVPEPPMGAVLGFHYYDADNRGDGDLRFFHVQGIGRSLLFHLHDALHITEGIAGPHVVLTSGTSWAPGSWRYHIQTPPHYLLIPERAKKEQKIRCYFKPLADPDAPTQRLSVSGKSNPADRIRSLRAMIGELTRKRGFGPEAASLLDRELAELEEHRKRILLVVGSYEEAREVGDKLARDLDSAPGEDVLTLIPDGNGETPWSHSPDKLLRSMLPTLAQKPVRFLIAPLQAIERGHNILVGQEAAIGSVYFLVRPFPRPGDPHTAIQRMNAWADALLPTLDSDDIANTGLRFRELARQEWDRVLKGGETYKGLMDRNPILWTQLVLVWQCIGRLLRGGASARVHFIDAKWCEVSAGLVPGEYDTEDTSMLIGFRKILHEALNNPDPGQSAIAEALYGLFAMALNEVEGVRYE